MCYSLFVDIICIGLYVLVSVTNSATIYNLHCGVKRGMRLSKMVRCLYKMILITQTTLRCVVKSKVLVKIEFQLS